MCGIAGSISQHDENPKSSVEHMLGKMLHRGPDGQGVIVSGLAALGHLRLAILDLSQQAAQPMWDASQRYCIVFNGEIYNFAALRNELTQLGYTFTTRSDTEVLLNAWVAWGTHALQKLVGMFAFGIWDKHEQVFTLARDRMGEKPLFYSGYQGDLTKGLIFASELKGLCAHPAVRQNLSLPAMSEFLSQNYLLTDTCIYDDVFKLPPAHYLTYRLGELPKIVNYWRLETFFQQKSELSFDDEKEQLSYLIKTATQQESYADVPVGAFLSGGVDSSTIVAQMARENAENVRTFSIGFPNKSFNELPASGVTAKHLQVSHQTKMVYPTIQELLPQLAYIYDEPFADSSMVPTYLLAQFARQFVKVSLSGDGGDELFGGYVTYQADRMHHYVNRLPQPLIKALTHITHKYIPTSFSKISLDYKLKQFLRGCSQDFQRAHTSWRTIFSVDDKIQLFHPEYRSIAALDPFTKIQPFFDNVSSCHPLDQAMYVDMKTWLPDDILVKVDRASMANSLEVRAPFLDHTIVEFAASLPVNYKIRGRHGKHILKQSQASLLPRAVLKRRKEGFNSPMALWLNNELYDMAYAATTSQKMAHWFQRPVIDTLWQQHRKFQRDNSHQLFGLLNLALWLEAFNI